MGFGGNKYSYGRRLNDLVIWEETSPGTSRRIATIPATTDRYEIAKNMVAALNSRHRYLQKIKNEKTP